MPTHKHYAVCFLITVLVLLSVIAVTNWFVDPYERYGSKNLQYFANKPLAREYRRKFKIYRAQSMRPQSIILGTSRAENSLNPDNPHWQFLPVFNLALPGSSLGLAWRNLQVLHDHSPVKQIILGLDLIMFAFAVDKPSATRFFIDKPEIDSRPDSHAKTLLSFDTLRNSYKTLMLQNQLTCYTKHGLHVSDCPVYFVDGQHASFERNEKWYVSPDGAYGPCWAYSASDAQHYTKLLRPILAFAYRENIALTMYISPVHARQLELLDAMDLWPAYEFWKRTLVNINAVVAKQYQQPPFPLWDFSGYNHITTESVPRPGDKQKRMRYYMDSSHYYAIIGDQILARLLSDHAAPQPAFGQQLTRDNLDQWLADIRQSRQHYRQNHPVDVADIQQIVASRELRPCSLTHAN